MKCKKQSLERNTPAIFRGAGGHGVLKFGPANGIRRDCDLAIWACFCLEHGVSVLGGELGSGRLLAAPPGNRSCAFWCSDLCLRLLCAVLAMI